MKLLDTCELSTTARFYVFRYVLCRCVAYKRVVYRLQVDCMQLHYIALFALTSCLIYYAHLLFIDSQ